MFSWTKLSEAIAWLPCMRSRYTEQLHTNNSGDAVVCFYYALIQRQITGQMHHTVRYTTFTKRW